MEERTGEAFELGEQLTVVGKQLHPGDVAPDFALDSFDGEAIQTVRLADSAGSVRLLNVVNSLDTPVCHVETHRWETMRGNLLDNVQIATISMDCPSRRPAGRARRTSRIGRSHRTGTSGLGETMASSSRSGGSCNAPSSSLIAMTGSPTRNTSPIRCASRTTSPPSPPPAALLGRTIEPPRRQGGERGNRFSSPSSSLYFLASLASWRFKLSGGVR